ncbi:uncharacterized protein LOC132606031 [Lycium barbarum]|uniref:uncharacterized protein LOC132606031 n=1 Tax=Lycium barbarum TaxID=112863 RepID=UPI00293E9944|nr:uncharacterized protein LOC132606031 [Lycium barbarum]
MKYLLLHPYSRISFTKSIQTRPKDWGLEEQRSSNPFLFTAALKNDCDPVIVGWVMTDYFTKWVEATSHKSVTKKVVADFIKNNLIRHFGMPGSIITDNEANLMKDICEQFKTTHTNSTTYRPHMNRVVESANKNIKRILRKMIDNYKNWHEQLPYALLGYRTKTRTSTEATPYLLVYSTEAVIHAEVEIPSLRIIQEAELNNAKWVRNCYEQLAMIDEKRMVAVCHGQLYR